MLYETPHLRVTADDGIATVWLAFPGSPVNALCPTRLRELDRAFNTVLDDPHLDVVVIRSGLPAGFCGGYTPGIVEGLISDDDAAAFAHAGQRVFARLAESDVVSVAFIEGPCVGPGLELALGCDYRLAVAGPDSAFGFLPGMPPCWGGSTRLRRFVGRRTMAKFLHGGMTLTAREAQRAGLVDHAFCQRRGKIELRTWLDAVQAGFSVGRVESSRPAANRTGGSRRLDPPYEEGFAAERVVFRHAIRMRKPTADDTAPEHPLPCVVAVESRFASLAVEAALHGSRAAILASASIPDSVDALLAAAGRRGRATPLEVNQARTRISTAAAAAGLIVADAKTLAHLHVKPSAVAAVVNGPARRPRDIACRFLDSTTVELRPDAATCPDAVAALSAWLRKLGVRTTTSKPTAGQTTHRAAA